MPRLIATCPEETKGARELIAYLKKEKKLSNQKLEAVTAVLADPKKSFPTGDLAKALRKRWEQISFSLPAARD